MDRCKHPNTYEKYHDGEITLTLNYYDKLKSGQQSGNCQPCKCCESKTKKPKPNKFGNGTVFYDSMRTIPITAEKHILYPNTGSIAVRISKNSVFDATLYRNRLSNLKLITTPTDWSKITPISKHNSMYFISYEIKENCNAIYHTGNAFEQIYIPNIQAPIRKPRIYKYFEDLVKAAERYGRDKKVCLQKRGHGHYSNRKNITKWKNKIIRNSAFVEYEGGLPRWTQKGGLFRYKTRNKKSRIWSEWAYIYVRKDSQSRLVCVYI